MRQARCNPAFAFSGRRVYFLALFVAGCASPTKQPPPLETTVDVPTVNRASAPIATTEPGQESRWLMQRGNDVLVRPANPFPAVQETGGNLTLNFEGADVREVLRTVLGDVLQENYIVDPRVGGTITLRTARPIPKAAALHILEEVLRMNGSVILREADGIFRVLPSAMAGKGNLTPQVGGIHRPPPEGFSIQILPLRYIGASEMAKILEPLAGEPASVRADSARNLLILAGTQMQLRHMIETVDMFDVDWLAGMSVGLFTLQNADAKSVLAEIESLLGDKNLGPLAGGALRIQPIERLNALLVVSPRASLLESARVWIERFDRPAAGAGGQRLFVYPVQNGKAEVLATLLNDAFSKRPVSSRPAAPTLAPGMRPATAKSSEPAQAASISAPASPSPGGTAGGEGLAMPQDVRVIADKDNNALLILASPSDYERIEQTLKRLDVVPRQVLIEVTIAEVTLTDEFQFGLEWYFTRGNRIRGQLDAGSSGISPLVPGFSYAWTRSTGDLAAVLNLLAKDSRLNIISSPHVTVADNQTAKIQVGDRVPTISQVQSATNTSGVIESVQYIETGVLLSVTPRVNSGGLVTLEVSQEVSNATQTTTSSINSPTIQRRKAESTVTVQSGETLVLAGLINENKGRVNDGLPLLSRIPLLGGLFGKQSFNNNRTELIIMITPRVLNNAGEAAEITAEYRKRAEGLARLIQSHENRANLTPILKPARKTDVWPLQLKMSPLEGTQ